jgi:hypothetical protein
LLVYHTLKNAKENGAPIYMPLYVPPILLLVGALMFMLHSVVKVSTGLFNLKVAHNVSILDQLLHLFLTSMHYMLTALDISFLPYWIARDILWGYSDQF